MTETTPKPRRISPFAETPNPTLPKPNPKLISPLAFTPKRVAPTALDTPDNPDEDLALELRDDEDDLLLPPLLPDGGRLKGAILFLA
ncbi:hypothetical protein [Planktothrix tepida]|uniref:hypothetical protein n=1 Tax=Planktothrix tepida TaxID=1678309 RepID=UPI0020B43948|nr:hypothetical protein [Planktothrix tepida]